LRRAARRRFKGYVGLSGSCQVETHHESIDRSGGWNPDGLRLLFERLDELDALGFFAAALQFRVNSSVIGSTATSSTMMFSLQANG